MRLGGLIKRGKIDAVRGVNVEIGQKEKRRARKWRGGKNHCKDHFYWTGQAGTDRGVGKRGTDTEKINMLRGANKARKGKPVSTQ